MYGKCFYPSPARSARKHRLRRTSMFCFRANAVEPEATIGFGSKTLRSLYARLKLTVNELEIKDRGRHVKAHIIGGSCNGSNYCGGCSSHQRHRQRRSRVSAANFSYDPYSYALNFDDDVCIANEEYKPRWSFTARLPVSPGRKSNSTPSTVGFVRIC